MWLKAKPDMDKGRFACCEEREREVGFSSRDRLRGSLDPKRDNFTLIGLAWATGTKTPKPTTAQRRSSLGCSFSVERRTSTIYSRLLHCVLLSLMIAPSLSVRVLKSTLLTPALFQSVEADYLAVKAR